MQFSESLRLLFLSLFLLSIRFGPLLIHYLAIWWLLEVRDWRKRTGKFRLLPLSSFPFLGSTYTLGFIYLSCIKSLTYGPIIYGELGFPGRLVPLATFELTLPLNRQLWKDAPFRVAVLNSNISFLQGAADIASKPATTSGTLVHLFRFQFLSGTPS